MLTENGSMFQISSIITIIKAIKTIKENSPIKNNNTLLRRSVSYPQPEIKSLKEVLMVTIMDIYITDGRRGSMMERTCY